MRGMHTQAGERAVWPPRAAYETLASAEASWSLFSGIKSCA